MKNLIYRYFQIGFDTRQFSETADMVDLISDALEISFQKKGDKNIMTEDSSRAFLLSMVKKNTLVTKVLIGKKKFSVNCIVKLLNCLLLRKIII